MVESRYDSIFLEMETLSQQYALGKMARKALTDRLKSLQEQLSSLAFSEALYSHRRKAFYQGFGVGVALLPVLFLLYKIIKTVGISSYWG